MLANQQKKDNYWTPDPDQIIELTAQENDIQFGWALLNYSHPLKNRFAYRLENHDLEWKTIKNGQDITYMNLPPGHYILKTKGSNNNGIWNEAGSSINIHVAKPWYASYMAYFVYSLMIVMGLVFGYLFMRTGRVAPLVIAHTIMNTAVFIGFPLVAGFL